LSKTVVPLTTNTRGLRVRPDSRSLLMQWQRELLGILNGVQAVLRLRLKDAWLVAVRTRALPGPDPAVSGWHWFVPAQRPSARRCFCTLARACCTS